MSRTFYNKSRASGTCKTCGGAITKGQPAWWGPKAGWQCTNCRPAAGTPEPEKQPANGKLPGVRITSSGTKGSRVDLEFDRLLDAAHAATTFGQGSLDNVPYVDSLINEHSGQKFFSGKTPAGLLHSIVCGERAMTELVERFRSEIADETALPTENRRRVRRGRDTGDEIDVDRFLNRIPEMWNRVEAEPTPARRVTITINGAVSHKQTQDELGYRAAAAIALADKLTELGASVEIRLMSCTTEGPTSKVRNLTASVIVKHSDHPMSIPDLATACCLIGAFRLAMVYGSLRYLTGEAETGLGYPTAIPQDRQVGDFIADRQITSRAAAVAWVQDSINKFSQCEVSHG